MREEIINLSKEEIENEGYVDVEEIAKRQWGSRAKIKQIIIVLELP